MPVTETLSIPVEARSHRLEARLVRGQPAAALAVIAPPHPLYGGTFGNPVVRTLEHALAQHGYGTLAFNFRGTGASSGEPSGDLDDALADYVAAARAVPDASLGLVAGYSFGGIAALDAAVTLGTPRLLMIAPPLSLLEPARLAQFAGTLWLVLGDDDAYASVEETRAALAAHPRGHVTVLPQVDHFFLGSATAQLAETLRTLALHEPDA